MYSQDGNKKITAVFDIQEAQLNELLDLERRGPLYLARCKGMTVGSDHDMAAADKLIGEGAAMNKAVKGIIKPVKDRFNAILEDVRTKEKEMLADVDFGANHLVDQIAKYQIIREEKIREEIKAKRLEEQSKARIAALEMAEQGLPAEAVRSMEDFAETPADLQVGHVPQMKTKTTIKDDWIVELVSKEEHLIPKEFLVPVNEAMRKAVAANIKKIVVARAGNIAIPGIRITTTNRAIKRAS